MMVPPLRALRRRLPGLRVHHAAVRGRGAFHHDAVTRLQSRPDNPAAADAIAELDGSRRDPIVGPDDADLRHTLHVGDRALRDDDGVCDGARFGADPTVLAGPQRARRVWKRGADADGAGLRIDVTVCGEEAAALRIHAAVSEHQRQGRAIPPQLAGGARTVDAAGDAQVLLLAQWEIRLDR